MEARILGFGENITYMPVMIMLIIIITTTVTTLFYEEEILPADNKTYAVNERIDLCLCEKITNFMHIDFRGFPRQMSVYTSSLRNFVTLVVVATVVAESQLKSK